LSATPIGLDSELLSVSLCNEKHLTAPTEKSRLRVRRRESRHNLA
jgi:hypothetical protein